MINENNDFEQKTVLNQKAFSVNGKKKYRERLLGSRGRFFFEPITNMANVAPENGSRLFNIAPQ